MTPQERIAARAAAGARAALAAPPPTPPAAPRQALRPAGAPRTANRAVDPLARQLVEHIDRCGWSDVHIRKLTGISKMQLSHWRTGKSAPRSSSIVRVLTALGATFRIEDNAETTVLPPWPWVPRG